ncbi:hypothetical protein G3T14_14865 [Methylobacterium sp. BTF04]|uniref:hypothetical protein n=1 Tax=Methylobacterium sp. BTF04 TaxID=2708300 RepID=UPI0013D6D984|nr:hypothetical protein [Methylobacterium sp. BTF04]NEU13403.1 hypothetical protein [Methylobacterium sp. BTF04]
MNLSVLALMCAIAAGFVGLVVYAIAYDHPWLLTALALGTTVAFAPWHRLR